MGRKMVRKSGLTNKYKISLFEVGDVLSFIGPMKKLYSYFELHKSPPYPMSEAKRPASSYDASYVERLHFSENDSNRLIVAYVGTFDYVFFLPNLACYIMGERRFFENYFGVVSE
jgi:hypothetical protein